MVSCKLYLLAISFTNNTIARLVIITKKILQKAIRISCSVNNSKHSARPEEITNKALFNTFVESLANETTQSTFCLTRQDNNIIIEILLQEQL